MEVNAVSILQSVGLGTQIGQNEKHFLNDNPTLIPGYNQAQASAGKFSLGHFGGSDWKRDNVDSLRHATWSGLMVLEGVRAGKTPEEAARLAHQFGKAHEWDHPNNKAEQKMDLYNNSVGRQVALDVLKRNPSATYEDIQNAMVEAQRKGRLHNKGQESLRLPAAEPGLSKGTAAPNIHPPPKSTLQHEHNQRAAQLQARVTKLAPG